MIYDAKDGSKYLLNLIDTPVWILFFFKKKANLKTIYMALSFLCLLSTSLHAALMSPVVVGSLSEDLYALVVISQATPLYSINLC